MDVVIRIPLEKRPTSDFVHRNVQARLFLDLHVNGFYSIIMISENRRDNRVLSLISISDQ